MPSAVAERTPLVTEISRKLIQHTERSLYKAKGLVEGRNQDGDAKTRRRTRPQINFIAKLPCSIVIRLVMVKGKLCIESKDINAL